MSSLPPRFMRASVLFVVAALALCAVASTPVSVQGQVPIPYRPDGWAIGGPLEAPIHMNVFVDLLCPDCAGAWPTIKQLISFYGSKLAVSLHAFPLPYHTYGFPVAQAAHVVMKGGVSATKFADFIFAQQSNFWNGAIANQTLAATDALLAQMVVANKLSTASAFAAGMASPTINMDARISWKYGCSRGVAGTPTFFVNGVTLDADPSWSLADWRSVLDPLLQPQPKFIEEATEVAPVVAPVKPSRRHHHRGGQETVVDAPAPSKCQQRSQASRVFVSSVADCPPGQPVCNYLPGKSECCFAGEMCIPNVGCRC